MFLLRFCSVAVLLSNLRIFQLNVTSEERDSAFDLSLSSQQEIRELAGDSDTDIPISEDEFGDENLENYGVSCI
jgi:hypothetical protein